MDDADSRLEASPESVYDPVSRPANRNFLMAVYTESFTPSGINKYILEIGQYGSSPRPEFQQLGKETLGFVLKDVISLSFQPTFTWINIIGIQNQKIANLLSVQTSAEYPDNLLANKDEINYESKIKYVDNGNILYDIEIHAIGTNKKGKSIDKVTKYRILGDKYVAD